MCVTVPRFELTSQRQKVSRLPTEPSTVATGKLSVAIGAIDSIRTYCVTTR